MINFYYLSLFLVNIILLIIIFINLNFKINKCCQDKSSEKKNNYKKKKNLKESNKDLILCNKENVKYEEKAITVLVNKYLIKNLKKGDLITGIQFKLKNSKQVFNYKSSNFTIEILNLKTSEKILVKSGVNIINEQINDYTSVIKFDQNFTYQEEDIVIEIKIYDNKLYNFLKITQTTDNSNVPIIQLEINQNKARKLVINPSLLINKKN